jgi:hypothetical protein
MTRRYIKCSWSGAPNIVERILGVGTKIQIKKEVGEASLHPFHLTAHTRMPALPARFPTSVLRHANAAKSFHLAMPGNQEPLHLRRSQGAC